MTTPGPSSLEKVTTGTIEAHRDAGISVPPMYVTESAQGHFIGVVADSQLYVASFNVHPNSIRFDLPEVAELNKPETLDKLVLAMELLASKLGVRKLEVPDCRLDDRFPLTDKQRTFLQNAGYQLDGPHSSNIQGYFSSYWFKPVEQKQPIKA